MAGVKKTISYAYTRSRLETLHTLIDGVSSLFRLGTVTIIQSNVDDISLFR